jgi:DNA-binding IclR family transcriptional regulator
MQELLERLALVRERGYAESHSEAGRGVGALAVAVRDDRTAEVLSFCITFPESTVEPAELQSLTQALLKAKSDIMRTPYER